MKFSTSPTVTLTVPDCPLTVRLAVGAGAGAGDGFGTHAPARRLKPELQLVIFPHEPHAEPELLQVREPVPLLSWQD